MTARQVFEAMLTELNNTNSPSLLLDDYNHFINKAIAIYINKRYNVYDTTQQTTDDLRVLKATAVLPVELSQKVMTKQATAFGGTGSELSNILAKDKSFDAIYEVNLPSDYLHTLNCLCIYQVTKRTGCYDPGDAARYAAKRLTADSWSTIVNDYYNRPTPKTPYYYIHNVNTDTDLPTNKYTASTGTLGSGTDLYATSAQTVTSTTATPGTITSGITLYTKSGDTYTAVTSGNDIVAGTTYYKDQSGTLAVKGTDYTEPVSAGFGVSATTSAQSINFATAINSNNNEVSTVERQEGVRYGNASNVRMEIRYGQADIFVLKGVMVDYIKAPQHVRLTKNQLDLTEDTSQILEFPDYVCQEIINELVKLVMANNVDPRIQTVPIVSQSIVDPVQQLASNARAAQTQAAARA